MLRNNHALLAMVLIYTGSCAAYNVAGIGVTGTLGAVQRTMIEATRSLVVWGVGLSVHEISPESPFSEVLTRYSWLQLLGFALLIAGQTTFGGLVRLPCFNYPPYDQASTEGE